MEKLSLRDKKIAYLQKQQADLKRSLLGRRNGEETPIKTAPIETKQRKRIQMQRMQMQRMQKAQQKPTLMEEKRKTLALRQRQMKMPVSKVSIKSFY